MDITVDDLPLARAYRWERERRDRIFLTQPSGRLVLDWTWGRAVDESRRVAAYLKAQPWEPGSRIGILSKNSAWWIMADLAIWMSGHVSVPIYPSLRAQAVRDILAHCGAAACFTGEMEKETEPVCGCPGPQWIGMPNGPPGADVVWDGLVATNAPLGGAPMRPGDELATILYTSGTTGKPKGVMHRFSGLAHNAKALAELLGLNKEQRTLSYLPLAHILERAGGEAVALRLANRVYFTEGIHTFLRDLERARPTLFLAVPRLLVKFQEGVLAKVPQEKLDRLLRVPAVRSYVRRKIVRQMGLHRAVLAACGGAPLPPEVLLWYRRLGVPLAEGYGMTETMITHVPRPDAVRPGCVGPAVAGVETRVGEEGELLVRSPMNMIGYYREPELTRAAFTEDGFFRTGDAVRIEADGQLRIVGRLKEQFKTSKGKYVAPAPIESKLLEHPGVEACCLMGSGESSPFAVIVLSDALRARCSGQEARLELERSLGDRLRRMNEELDPYERISTVVIADGPWTIGNGMLTPTLKVRRGVVEESYRQRIDELRRHGTPIVWESVARPNGASYAAGAEGPAGETARPDAGA